MKLPLQITFRHMERSDALEADIREKAGKLDQYCDQIMACRVVVDAPHQHHQQGNLYHISVDLTVPGGEIVASRESDQHHAHEDAYVATRDAFDAVQRRPLGQFVGTHAGQHFSHRHAQRQRQQENKLALGPGN